jgi:hypothetical protein
VVAGVWLLAHLENTGGWPLRGRWMDARGVYHTGNPYTAAVLSVPIPSDRDEGGQGGGNGALAGAASPDDAGR